MLNIAKNQNTIAFKGADIAKFTRKPIVGIDSITARFRDDIPPSVKIVSGAIGCKDSMPEMLANYIMNKATNLQKCQMEKGNHISLNQAIKFVCRSISLDRNLSLKNPSELSEKEEKLLKAARSVLRKSNCPTFDVCV